MTERNIRRAKTKTPTFRQKANEQPKPRTVVFVFFAAALGSLVGIPAAFGVAMPMLHAELARDTASLKRVVQVTPAANTIAGSATASQCSTPSSPAVKAGNVSAAKVQTAVAMTSEPNGAHGGGFTINKFIRNSLLASNTGSISNTGPRSNNQLSFTNTNNTHVENNNWLHVANNNPQSATSGNAQTSQNTSGGSATSGTVSNKSDSTFTFAVTN